VNHAYHSQSVAESDVQPETATGDVAAVAAKAVNIAAYPIDALIENELSTRHCKWLRLFEADRQAPIWLHPDFVMLEQRQIRMIDNRPGRFVKATVGSQAVALAALLPKRRTFQLIPGVGPRMSLRGYVVAGSHVLVRPGWMVPEKLFQVLGDQLIQDGADFLLVEHVDEECALWQQLASLQMQGFRMLLPKGIQPRYQIQFSASPEDYWSRFSSSSRKTFRRLLRKAEHMRLERITEPEQVATFLRDAVAVSAQSWQRKQLGSRIENDEFTRERLEILAERRELRSYLLYDGELPIAFELGLQYGDTFFGEETAYDLRYAKSSPGQVLLLRELEDLMSFNQPGCYDFGFGDAEYKQHFADPGGRSADVLLIPPTWRARSRSWILEMALSAGRAAKATVEKLGLARRLRSSFRGSVAN
jgi:hypothetical protein